MRGSATMHYLLLKNIIVDKFDMPIIQKKENLLLNDTEWNF